MAKRDEHLEAMVNHVVELIETHGVEWSKGWRDISCRPSNVDTGTVYRGWNSFWLAMNGATHVATFKGWQRLGYSCKGLKGKGIFITTRKLIKKENDKGEDASFVRWGSVAVFRAQDVRHEETGEPWVPPVVEDAVDTTLVLENVDRFFAATGADWRYADSGGAFFSPADDFIQMPRRELFEGSDTQTSTEAFYSVGCHELVHWAAGPNRLNANKDYHTAVGRAKEELVAEFGSILLSIDLGIEITPREDHAAYLESWLGALKEKNAHKYLMEAATEAQRRIDYLEGLTGIQVAEAA
jgi:antirestriction protein ArdC